MSIPDYSSRKDPFKPTSHKSEFSFSSPQQDPQTVLKQTLMESRRIEMTARNRKQLFNQLKENTNILSLINKSYTKEFVQQMRTEQRVEVEKLLLEISRLHDLLEDQERMHKYAVQRLKQQSQQIALLRISNLKQSQISQVEAIQIQLKKTKQALDEKTFAYEELQKTSTRKIESLSSQNQTLRADLKELVEKKNIEVFQLRNQYNKQNQQNERRKNQNLEEMKSLADKQLKKILKKLQQKQKTIENLTKQFQSTTKESSKLQKLFEKQKQELTFKLQKIIQHQRERQYQITQNLKQFYETEAQQSQEQLRLQKQTFKFEIQQFLKIINIKDNQAQRNLVYRQTEKIDFKLQLKNLQTQNQFLKKLLQQIKRQQLQELELLKVKMSVLHKSDIQALVRLYQAKLQSLVKDNEYAKAQAQKSDQQAKKQRETMYEMKKKYDRTVSFLRQQIHQLTVGANHFQKQVKEKLENQKSMMMLTSRNFIKQNENKNNNIRFYQQQLRKLRQLLQIQAQEVEESEKNVEEKIKLAEDELHRLSNKIIQVKSEAQQSQKKLKQTIQEKNKQIKRLNQILNNPTVSAKVSDNLADQIRKLDQVLAKKQDELRSLRNQVQDLESNLRLVRGDNERLIIQNQINSEDAQKKYKFISDKNLADMKAFYDRRIQELQNDKRELNKVNSSQSEQITQLIKRYKQLEEGMKQLVQQTKKRSDLETRIINLGMDNNLVKNIGQLFHK